MVAHMSGKGSDASSANGWNSTLRWVPASSGVVWSKICCLLRLALTRFVASGLLPPGDDVPLLDSLVYVAA